jgi:hypothetical protein
LPSVRLSASPTWLRGAPLTGASHLRLVASENGGTVFVVDVDHHSARAVPGLGFPPQALPAVDLSAAPGGALADVRTPTCVSCAIRETQTDFLIGANGTARRIGQVTLTRHQYTTTQALDSTATWVLTWPTGGRCTLRLEPSLRPAVPVRCGRLGSDTAAGLLVGSGDQVLVLDPLTGRIRERIRVSGPLVMLQSDLALTSTDPGFPGDSSFPANLTLLNLATGSRKRLAWPSMSSTSATASYPSPTDRSSPLSSSTPRTRLVEIRSAKPPTSGCSTRTPAPSRTCRGSRSSNR